MITIHIYKLNLYNALAAINNSPICLEYFSKASLPNEILYEIASYIKPISKKNKALIEPLRQEIYEARVKTCKKVIPLLFGTAVALGLGMAFSPLETTMLCGAAGMMYFTYDTKFEEAAMQLVMPLIVNIAAIKALIIIGEIQQGIEIPYLNKLAAYGMLSTITVIPNIITLAMEKATNNKPISYTTSVILSSVLPNLFYTNLCRENCLNLSLNQHLLQGGFYLLVSSISLALGLFSKDGSLINIATSTKEDREIFADVSYKTCISLKNYTMTKVTKFADRVSKSLENLAEGVSDLQSNVMMR